jgi:ATP-dependent Lon protease
MDPKHQKMVKILTHKYKENERDASGAWTADFIQSKGEGQIFLLHGPPGVGKTYTAECIAELTRKMS